jgi:hypothetical protein
MISRELDFGRRHRFMQAADFVNAWHSNLLKALAAFLLVALFLIALPFSAYSQTNESNSAEAVIERAIKFLGGDRYLKTKNQVSEGKYSILRDGTVISFQSFIDVIIFPETERTEFRGSGTMLVQANKGESGWIFDGDREVIKDQTPEQINNFKQSIKTGFDYLLRGFWKGKAKLSYVGKRPGGLGRRNDVVKLTYDDGLEVEFEFAFDGTPQKAITRKAKNNDSVTIEEDRYAQFVDVGGIKAPFIVDKYVNGQQLSRINYTKVEFDKRIPDSIFLKPTSIKQAKSSPDLN